MIANRVGDVVGETGAVAGEQPCAETSDDHHGAEDLRDEWRAPYPGEAPYGGSPCPNGQMTVRMPPLLQEGGRYTAPIG